MTHVEESFEALDQRLLKVPPCEGCARSSTIARAVDGFVRCSECRRRLLEEVLRVAAFEVCARCDLVQKKPHYAGAAADFFLHDGDECPASNLWKLIVPAGP